MKKFFFSLIAVLFTTLAFADSTTLVMSSADIAKGATGTVALATNGYGSQATATESTWYTFSVGNVDFTSCKVAVATDANGGGIQVQGNASDATKQGFIANVSAMQAITSIKIVARTTTSSTYDPSFSVYVGTTQRPTTAVELTTNKVTGDSFNTFTYNATLDGTSNYFQIWNDKAGALYIDTIEVSYTATAIAVEKPAFSVASGSYYGTQTVELSTTTSGAKVYYSTDGENYTEYTAALSVAEDATISAYAVLGTDTSKVATATYKIAKSYASISDIFNVETNSQPVSLTLTNAKITSVYVTTKVIVMVSM